MDETQGFILNDTVTFEIKLTIEQPSDATAAQRALSSFAAANQKLLKSGMHSDVTLICEGEEIPAHKNILAARSSVFDAMFAHKMAESLESKVMIDDMRLDVFRAFLRYELQLLGCFPNSDSPNCQLFIHERALETRAEGRAKREHDCGI